MKLVSSIATYISDFILKKRVPLNEITNALELNTYTNAEISKILLWDIDEDLVSSKMRKQIEIHKEHEGLDHSKHIIFLKKNYDKDLFNILSAYIYWEQSHINNINHTLMKWDLFTPRIEWDPATYIGHIHNFFVWPLQEWETFKQSLYPLFQQEEVMEVHKTKNNQLRYPGIEAHVDIWCDIQLMYLPSQANKLHVSLKPSYYVDNIIQKTESVTFTNIDGETMKPNRTLVFLRDHIKIKLQDISLYSKARKI